jgi:hypothetical protein
MKLMVWMLGAIVVLVPGLAQAQMSGNLLGDPGFEEWAGDAETTNWVRFGNAASETLTPRTGMFVAKVYGNFKTERNHSGLYQDAPAAAGKRYVASAYIRHNSGDSLQGDNRVWLKLEFYDAAGQQMKAFESARSVKDNDPANKWMLLSTSSTPAPEGTAKARVVILFEQQADNATGAVLVDDVALTATP